MLPSLIITAHTSQHITCSINQSIHHAQHCIALYVLFGVTALVAGLLPAVPAMVVMGEGARACAAMLSNLCCCSDLGLDGCGAEVPTTADADDAGDTDC